MERRTREPQKVPRTVIKLVKRLQEELQIVLSLLKPNALDARKRLAELTLRLPSLLGHLRKKTRNLGK